MIGASKILTVSYGTFSCTLEGFDEPFNTMKAIAEYFRDLAADDRYFGAEPPTPDAAMLHKIAEREIHRRVEAKIQENGVILRTGEALDAPAKGPAPMPTVTAPVLAAPVVLPPAAPEFVAPAAAASQAVDDDDQPMLMDTGVYGDSVAAKLSRLRATAAATAVAAEPVTVAETYDEDQPTDDIAVLVAEDIIPANDLPHNLIENTAQLIEKEDQSTTDLDFPADDFAEVSWADDAEAESEFNAPLAAPNAEDVAFEETPDQPADADDLNDFTDQDALDDLARLDGILTADVDQDGADDDYLEADLQTESHSQDANSDADSTAADDAVLASLGNLIAENDHADRAVLNDDFDDEFGEYEDSASDNIGFEDTLERQLSSDETTADPEEAQFVAAPLEETIVNDAAEPEVVQRARARVIKIRRIDAQAFEAAPIVDAQPSLLSDEAEAALQAELSALEAELLPPHPSATTRSTDTAKAAFDAELRELAAEIGAAPAQPLRPQRPVRSITVARPMVETDAQTAGLSTAAKAEVSVEVAPLQQVTIHPPAHDDAADARHTIEAALADDAVGRLMAQTNSAMDGADTKRRQSAISHLKAAVAATEADRLVVPYPPKDDLLDSYRSDLDSVVRPTAANSGDARAANADRPQPLVLVSAQRIDRLPRSENAPRPENAPRMVSPVRPRRIAVGSVTAIQQDSLIGFTDDDLDDGEGVDDADVNMFAETESFSDFADRLGASDLPDVLEAAAVYCASVLGRPEFSRPLVLRQISSLPEYADISREDGLRMFGTLLRQGRISKTRRGQFAVTDRSPILAEALRSVG